jgi:transposase
MLPGDAKTDARDALVIAKTALSFPQALRPIPEPTRARAELEVLVSFDNDLKADRTREVNRLRSVLLAVHPAFECALGDASSSNYVLGLLVNYGGPWAMRKSGIKKVLSWIRRKKHRVSDKTIESLFAAISKMDVKPDGARVAEEFIISAHAAKILELDVKRKDVTFRIKQLLEHDDSFSALMSMPGVGIKTASTILCCVHIDDFPTADHFCSYAGIAPRTRQSGTSIKGKSAAKGGNKALKSALFLSAFAAIRSDERSREYYDKKRAEGKHHNAAIISLARKRAKVMFAIMRSGVSVKHATPSNSYPHVSYSDYLSNGRYKECVNITANRNGRYGSMISMPPA